MSQKRYVVAAAILCFFLYLSPVVANALTSGQAATVVVGQSNLTSGSSGPTSATSLSIPTDVAVDSSGNVWVVDIANDRILEYTAPVTDGEAASIVLGQPDFVSNSPGLTASTLDNPFAIAIDSSGNVWVSDSQNNRVLEYVKGAGFTDGESASIVLGQPDFTSNDNSITNAITLSENRRESRSIHLATSGYPTMVTKESSSS